MFALKQAFQQMDSLCVYRSLSILQQAILASIRHLVKYFLRRPLVKYNVLAVAPSEPFICTQYLHTSAGDRASRTLTTPYIYAHSILCFILILAPHSVNIRIQTLFATDTIILLKEFGFACL